MLETREPKCKIQVIEDWILGAEPKCIYAVDQSSSLVTLSSYNIGHESQDTFASEHERCIENLEEINNEICSKNMYHTFHSSATSTLNTKDMNIDCKVDDTNLDVHGDLDIFMQGEDDDDSLKDPDYCPSSEDTHSYNDYVYSAGEIEYDSRSDRDYCGDNVLRPVNVSLY